MSLLTNPPAGGILYRFDGHNPLDGWTNRQVQGSTSTIEHGMLQWRQNPNTAIAFGSLYRPLPYGSGPQVITVPLLGWTLASAHMDLGLALMSGDPASNDFYVGGPGVSSSAVRAGVSLFSQDSTHVSRPSGTGTLGRWDQPCLIRGTILANGTGWKYELSTDEGATFTQFSTLASSSWTFTHFGIGGWHYSSAPGPSLLIPWIHVTNVTG